MHNPMTRTTKIFTFGEVVVLGSVAAMFLGGCNVLDTKVSRVPIPSSSMTVIVRNELAGCFDCQLYDHGHAISERQLLGSYVSGRCSVVNVSRASNIVAIDWSDEGTHFNAAIDIKERRFVPYSNNIPVQ